MAPTPPPSGTPSTPTRLVARALGVLLVVHPLPSGMYVLAVGLFAWLASTAAHRALDVGTLARVVVAMACAQFAIGATNDYLDQKLDAASKPSKPLVRGLISPHAALAVALVGSAVLLVLLAPLGLLALLLGLLVEGLGLAYDLGFKGTWVSGLLYAVYFPLIPLLAWVVFGRWQPFLPWVVPLGAALGVAMNVANSLPDVEADRAAGVRGLPHLLGVRRGLAVVWGTPVLALALLWTLDLTRVVPAHLAGMLVASGAAVVSVGVAVVLYAARPVAAMLHVTFIVQALGVVALATAWLAAVAF
ncbi:MAG TPA: UbiA family prenyltransferase [Ktedonobacterales bacterium]|nr:UbiA family prenyltransferase [Ktedonobacterales bacterium]